RSENSTPPKKQKLNYSGKKKIHASKAQVIVTGQGRILFLDVQLNYCHDMKLFRTSRRNLSKAQEILADSG
ncbi:IS5/IS1182 family transposase, partial [Streptococcus danieliae]